MIHNFGFKHGGLRVRVAVRVQVRVSISYGMCGVTLSRQRQLDVFGISL